MEIRSFHSPGYAPSVMVDDDRGIAATEFALVFPMLILLLLGIVETTNVVTANRRLQVVAGSIAQMFTQSTSGSVNYVDVHFAFDSTMVLFPLVLSDSNAKSVSWGNDISVTASSIVFTLQNSACTSNCIYNANVAWSAGSNKRPCGVTLTSAANSAPSNPNSLPTDSFGPGSMIVVDVSYQYTPAIMPKLIPKLTLSKSVYLRPRYIQPTSYIKYSVVSGDDGISSVCKGY